MVNKKRKEWCYDTNILAFLNEMIVKKLICTAFFLWQFDYAAIANKIFELSSRKHTPAFNRKRLYKLVKKYVSWNSYDFPGHTFFSS